MTVTLLQQRTREQTNAVAAEMLALLPVGALEQHGPHLPLGTDAIIVEQIAHRAAERLDGEVPILVAPTLAYGSSHHHLPYGATMSLSTSTYFAVLKDLVETLAVSGFRRVFILNGHGGNAELVALVARDVSTSHKIAVGGGSYWVIAGQALSSVAASPRGELPGHAGEFETSLILALYPELVEQARPSGELPPPAQLATYRFGSPAPFRHPTGYSDSPAAGDGRRGAGYLATCVESVADALRDFHKRALPAADPCPSAAAQASPATELA
ncbi:MAG: creatininase family protein [Micromonosporaceae bacterium]|nr:creatininase family protein [Micromonosporaceae bacterium]